MAIYPVKERIVQFLMGDLNREVNRWCARKHSRESGDQLMTALKRAGGCDLRDVFQIALCARE
jgi:hypothetical protein